MFWHMRRTTVRLPEPLLEEAKRYARQQHTTLTEVLVDGLRLVLKQSAGGIRNPMPLELPVCSASLTATVPFGAELPEGEAHWSAGAWEEYFDLYKPLESS